MSDLLVLVEFGQSIIVEVCNQNQQSTNLVPIEIRCLSHSLILQASVAIIGRIGSSLSTNVGQV